MHGEDFVVAGCGEDVDWPSQKLSDVLELVQQARVGPAYEQRSNRVEPLWDVQ